MHDLFYLKMFSSKLLFSLIFLFFFLMNHLIYRILENSNNSYNFLKPKVMPLNTLFCLTSSPKSKYIQLTIILDKVKLKILPVYKLKQRSVWYFCLKNK